MKMVLKIGKIILYVMLGIIAIYSSLIIIQKIMWKDKIPNILGYKNYIVLSGSMEPYLNIGDLVFVKESQDIKVNDIISFKVHNAIVTHRVIEIQSMDDKKVYITKGDANSVEDKEVLELDDIEGKYVFKIPKVGKVIDFFKKPLGLGIMLAVFGFILFINMVILDKKEKNEKKG